MKLRLTRITALFGLLCLQNVYAQRVSISHRADKIDSISFLQRRNFGDERLIKREADDEKKMALPHNLKVPDGAKIVRDKTLPPPPTVTHAQSPVADTSFTGLTDNNTTIPPDVQGAAGPNYLMSALNTQVSILTKSGAVVSTVTLMGFWPLSFGITEAFDPRLMYDPYAGRWILTCAGNPEDSSACLLVAVSATNDPTGQWYTYKINVDAAQDMWVDYPTTGFNKNWIVVNGNLYGVSDGESHGTKFWMLNKSDFYNKGAGAYTTTVDTIIGGTIQPAITYDSTVSTEYLVETWNGTAGYIAMWQITGPIGSESFSNIAYINTPSTWAATGPNGWDFAPQLGSAELIAADDDRMQKVVYRNGTLWCTQSVFLPEAAPTRSAIQWWQLSTTGGVLQRSIIQDSTGVRFYAYPSIAVNASNDVLIGYSSFSANQYASCDYALKTSCDAANTFESDYIYFSGVAPYYKTFGGTENRWGDYSATCVDPSNDNDFWTLQEYASTPSGGTSLWATAWASVKPGNTTGGPGTYTWTGTSSTNWFASCNWDQGAVPGLNSDVVIPGGTTNNPTISGNTANCNTIKINSSNGAVLTIDDTTGGALNVNQ